jgi:hypothetical protein
MKSVYLEELSTKGTGDERNCLVDVLAEVHTCLMITSNRSPQVTPVTRARGRTAQS